MLRPRLEDSTIFWFVKKEINQTKINLNFGLPARQPFLVFWERLKSRRKWAVSCALNCFRFFGEHLRAVSLVSSIPVLGLERVCPQKLGPWPWPRTFFGVLGLGFKRCILDSTSGYNCRPVTGNQLSSQADGAYAAKTIDSGLIPDRVQPKTVKICIHCFPSWHLATKTKYVKSPSCVVDRWQLNSRFHLQVLAKAWSLSPVQGNLVNIIIQLQLISLTTYA